MSKLTERGLEIDQGTLYPLLRRLESRELLESHWRVEESRPRRYYTISAKGAEVLPLLIEEWNQLTEVMKGLLQ
jgi:DNA-binding PadR family transcriptional regulator